MLRRPIVRCPRCGGWVTQRALAVEECAVLALTCIACGEELEIRDGTLVRTAYPANADTARLRARHEHTDSILRTSLQRRERRRAAKEESA